MKLDLNSHEKLIENQQKENQQRAHRALAPIFVGLSKAAELVDDADSHEVDEFVELLGLLSSFIGNGRVALRDGRPIAELQSSSSQNSTPAPAALPAGTDSSSDEFKQLAEQLGVDVPTLQKWMKNLFSPLTELTEGQLKGRSAALQMVAEGTIKVNDDGTPAVHDQLASVTAQFAPFQQAAASLDGLTKSDQSRLLRGINKVADESIKVESDGTPTAVKDLRDAQRKLDDAKFSTGSDDSVKKLEDVKKCVAAKHMIAKFGPEHYEVDFDQLQADTYKYLTGEEKTD